MRLYVEPMDVVVIEVSDEGKVKFESGDWVSPSLQERRAIVYAAEREIVTLREAVEALS